MPGSTTRPDQRGHQPLLGVAALAFWLAVWQLVSMAVGQELLVPSPATVLATLAQLAVTPAFWQTTATSLLRVLLGFLAGVLGGVVAAVLTTRYRLVDALLSPLLRVVRAAPVASFIILALVWIPTGRLPAFISFLMVVPVVWESMVQGIARQDRDLLEVAEVFGFGWWQTVRRIRIPLLLPFFATACATGMGLAWKSGVAAEVISRPAIAVGSRLQDAKINLETPQVSAWTITGVVLSLVLEGILRWAAGRATTWLPAGTAPAGEGSVNAEA